MKTSHTQNTRRLVGLSVLAALVVVLQLIAAITPPIGPFRLTFSNAESAVLLIIPLFVIMTTLFSPS